jgi:DNA-binding NarL/FixJ family response regulator
MPAAPPGPSAPTGSAIRILIVDDHPMLREGVAAVLDLQPDMELVGEAGNGAEAIARFRELRPDVTLMDLQMPGVSGLEAIETIRAEFPTARIVVLTTYAGDAQALRALKAGATGYLLKSTLRRELLDTIRNVHAGRRHLQSEVAQEIAIHAIEEALSDREVHVLRLVAAGRANKQIAWELSLSEDTIKAHLKSIFAKLDVADRTHAVTVAARRGIIEL